MSAVRKITVHLPSDLIDDAQEATGAGVTETIRQGLERLRRERFYAQLKALRGKIDFSGFDLDELREDKVYDWEDESKA
jgi:Arc/MetJ-type ribon-helix-helix transcriptional regulator